MMKARLSTFQLFFCLFLINSVLVVLIIWSFFTFISPSYYMHKVTSSLTHDSTVHETFFDTNGLQDYLEYVNIYEPDTGNRIILYDQNTNSIPYPQIVRGPGMGMGQHGSLSPMEITDLINTVTNKVKHANNVFRYTSRRTNIDTLVVFQQWDNGIIWIAQSALQPINRAISIFQTLFLWFALLGIAVSAALSWLISNKITKNVSKINQKVMNIASLSFDHSKKISVGFSKELENTGITLNLVADKLKTNMAALKDTNVRLKQELDKEKQLDTIRKQFVTDVSHDLKTPISIIQGYCEGLLDEIADDPAEYITAIRDEAFHMKNLVDSLLELAKLESEQTYIKQEKVNITLLIEEIEKRFTAYAKNHNRTVNFNITKECLWCIGAPIKLKQVFENLLKNSVAHGNENGEISVQLKKEKEIVFSVYNDASAIPEQEIPLIFERFYKLDRSRNRKTGGTGLGLSIVKSIVLKHGGNVGVVNEKNGVRFWVTLPLLPQQNESI
ncbi:HAMP domain-containing sensor histidine kinase [Petroclostridium sp. X23]|uniref:sensor histidine kinase n=1 Tax=Petroclostridium sp. X23 TaxID=3045146 RepID=UPI0024AC9824|nr:HAMP domain-containing sensor histidine kinase [Petroclostridium sp. X23]WHH60269.1 HAMP domain-containing sensor histidine kinase [Petroclostridium sp. X23]